MSLDLYNTRKSQQHDSQVSFTYFLNSFQTNLNLSYFQKATKASRELLNYMVTRASFALRSNKLRFHVTDEGLLKH